MSEWTFEQKAESFRREINKRFVEENEAWKEIDQRELAEAKTKNPEYFKRYPELDEERNSFTWNIYQKSKIQISIHYGIKIIIPNTHVSSDIINMFDNTEVAWSKVFIEAKNIDNEAVIVLSVMIVDYWDDEKSEVWRNKIV